MNTPRPHDDNRLDAWLASSQPPSVPAHLRRAILSAAHASAPPAFVSWRESLRALWLELGGLRIAAPVMVIALAIGMGAAQHLWQSSVPTDSGDDLMALALIDGDYDNLLAAQP
ncbi:MAG: hypothetical protein KDI69_01920 [Xanthomonadales bacterium]|nr:hypothetical protein [Xanthomonadales bacterium]